MEQECGMLRLELKEWEKSFAAGSGGKKAGREDIKQHPEIGTSIARQLIRCSELTGF